MVSLGELLQLRVSVNEATGGGWISLALLSLVLSPSPSDPEAPGAISLVTR